MRIVRLALIALMFPVVAACSLISHGSDDRDCAGEFDLGGLGEPLGSSSVLYTEMGSAVRAGQPVRMEDLTRAAGWSDGWDLMVDLHANIHNEDILNGLAQTPGYCWHGLPGESTPVPAGFYLFFKDHVPVQKVRWRGDTLPLQLRSGVSLTPESQLVTSYSKLVPA